MPLRLGPLVLDAGVIGGAVMPERGCRSRAAILDKRPLTWPLRVVIVVVRVWRSAAEGADIVYSYERGRHKYTTLDNGSGSR